MQALQKKAASLGAKIGLVREATEADTPPQTVARAHSGVGSLPSLLHWPRKQQPSTGNSNVPEAKDVLDLQGMQQSMPEASSHDEKSSSSRSHQHSSHQKGPIRQPPRISLSAISAASSASAGDEEAGSDASSVSPYLTEAPSMQRQDSLFLAHRRLSLAVPGKYGGAAERKGPWKVSRMSLNPGMQRMSGTLKAVGRSLMSSLSHKEPHIPKAASQTEPLDSARGLSGTHRKASVSFARELTRAPSRSSGKPQ